MIKKLQRKFIMITMGSLLVVMLILIGSINMINLYQTNQRLDGTIQLLAQNQGRFPQFDKGNPPKGKPHFDGNLNEETQFQTRYFIVKVDENGDVYQIDTSHIAAVTSQDASEYADKVMESNKTSGYDGIYKFQIVNQTEGYMIVFLDCRNQLQMATEVLLISSMVALGTLFLMFVLISVFSKRAIKPIIESSEKQKLFITDAGHEIKTPLAIISANADVLELIGGENEWIASIRNQTVRLDKLVKNLLTLSKMEEENIKVTFTEFDLSDTVEKIAGSFQTIAETRNKCFHVNVQPNIRMSGDENSIEQLISTLVDNAMKYASEGGEIKVSLSAFKKGAKLEVYNTTQDLGTQNLDKLFDRFYRADASRSRDTGGYGIGLSIAKSIVEAHHGKITVKSEDGNSICFTVVI